MSESKLEVTIISPQAYARAPWNKFHWKIMRVAPGRPGNAVEGCCAVASREGRTCVGFGTRKEALEAGSAKRAALFDSAQSMSQAG